MSESCADVLISLCWGCISTWSCAATAACGNASREEGNSQVILKWIQELRGFVLTADSVHMILYGINKI